MQACGLAWSLLLIFRVGQNHIYIYGIYIRYIYGIYIRYIYGIYIRCTYGILGLKITKFTVYIHVYIRFWPTLLIFIVSKPTTHHLTMRIEQIGKPPRTQLSSLQSAHSLQCLKMRLEQIGKPPRTQLSSMQSAHSLQCHAYYLSLAYFHAYFLSLFHA